MIAEVNRALDGFVRPEVPIAGAGRSAFQVCGITGWAVSSTVVLAVGWYSGASPWILGALILAGSLAFLTTAVMTKWITGIARLVFFRHAIMVNATALAMLLVLDAPVLPYLDLTALGLAIVLCFGRIGCLMVGCCHGAPAGIGVRYRDEHVARGFPHSLVGVRLFPSQALEAALAFALAILAAAIIVAGAEPGTACMTVAVIYSAARFLLEVTRGDWVRPILGGFSEAQWTAVVVLAAVATAELAGALPQARWHVAIAAMLVFALCALAAWRFLGHAPRHRLLHPVHVRDVAVALDALRAPGNRAAVIVATTSLGVRLSCSQHAVPSGAIEHVAISHRDGPMPDDTAHIIADLVRRLRPVAARHEVIARSGMFHLLLHR
jgi:Prolipoprotein diacylglyceryl transferase